jgi:radical SAM protein with 4Fe4S-binding SPASM domain
MSTVTRPAIPLLDEMRRLIADLRVPRWRLVPVMPIGRAASRADLLPDPHDLRTLLDFVRAARADGQLPVPELGEEGYLGRQYEGRVRPYLCECRAGITTGGILADGRIGSCPELGDAFVQGDIRRERFRDVWEDGYSLLRDRSWTRKGPCRECAAFDDCQGGSLHLYPTPGAELTRCFHLMLEGRTGCTGCR